MKIPFTLEIKHTLSCKRCNAEVSGGSRKAAAMKFFLHLKLTCPDRANNDLPFFKTLWELIRWRPK